MELSSPKIKKILMFQEKQLSSSNSNKFLIFREMELFYILGNRNPPPPPPPQKILILQEMDTLKNCLCFQKWNFRISQEELKPQKQY